VKNFLKKVNIIIYIWKIFKEIVLKKCKLTDSEQVLWRKIEIELKLGLKRKWNWIINYYLKININIMYLLYNGPLSYYN